jgi:hypothetical protein
MTLMPDAGRDIDEVGDFCYGQTRVGPVREGIGSPSGLSGLAPELRPNLFSVPPP